MYNSAMDGRDDYKGASPLTLTVDWPLDIDEDEDPADRNDFDYDKKTSSTDALLGVDAGEESSCEKEEGINVDSDTSRKRGPAKVGIEPLRRRKKPKGMPKRPLSAYNLFFQSERSKILGEIEGKKGGDLGGESATPTDKISFEDLGRLIGKRWKTLGDVERKAFEEKAEEDNLRYRKEMEVYNEKKKYASTRNYSEYLVADSKRDNMGDEVGIVPLGFRREQSDAPPPLSAFPTTASPVKARLPGTSDAQSPLSKGGVGTPSVAAGSGSSAAAGDFVQSHGRASAYLAPNWTPQHQQQRIHTQLLGPSSDIITPAGSFSTSQAPPPSTGPIFPSNLPVPPGMQLYLPDRSGRDRKYVVKYNFYTMTKSEAVEYMHSLESSARTVVPPPPPSAQDLSAAPTTPPTTMGAASLPHPRSLHSGTRTVTFQGRPSDSSPVNSSQRYVLSLPSSGGPIAMDCSSQLTLFNCLYKRHIAVAGAHMDETTNLIVPTASMI